MESAAAVVDETADWENHFGRGWKRLDGLDGYWTEYFWILCADKYIGVQGDLLYPFHILPSVADPKYVIFSFHKAGTSLDKLRPFFWLTAMIPPGQLSSAVCFCFISHLAIFALLHRRINERLDPLIRIASKPIPIPLPPPCDLLLLSKELNSLLPVFHLLKPNEQCY